MDVTSIADAEPGRRLRFEGVIRPAASVALRSPLGDRECVYWDVREGASDDVLERGVQPFWLEDATGRVLVTPVQPVVGARGERRTALLDQVVSDVDAVAARIRELKEGLREDPNRRELVQERRRLAKVATLLCAIRAEANGNVHLGGDLAGQREWIDRYAHLADDGPGAGSVGLRVQRWETVLCEGQRIAIEGRIDRAPTPPGIAGRGGGYRTAPTCLTLGDEPLVILGLGDAAPEPPIDAPTDAPTDETPPERRGLTPFESRVIGGLLALLTLGGLLYLLR